MQKSKSKTECAFKDCIKSQSCHHIESSQLICRANQLTGFYMMVTLAFNELTKQSF